MTAEGVSIGPCEVVAIDGQRRHEEWEDNDVGHGEWWCSARKYQRYSFPSTGSEIRRKSE